MVGSQRQAYQGLIGAAAAVEHTRILLAEGDPNVVGHSGFPGRTVVASQTTAIAPQATIMSPETLITTETTVIACQTPEERLVSLTTLCNLRCPAYERGSNHSTPFQTPEERLVSLTTLCNLRCPAYERGSNHSTPFQIPCLNCETQCPGLI